MSHEHGQWEGDVNEVVVEEWKAETTPFERVHEIVRSTYGPQYAREIGERARVSEPTTRKHLKRLVKTGHAETVETRQGVQYKRSAQTIAMERIVEIHRELSREELVAGIKRLRERLDEFHDRYEATDPDDLAIQIEDGAADDAWNAVTEWRSVEENLDIAKAALALYDFDPDTDGDHRAAGTGGAGAFAGTSSNAVESSASRTA